MKQALKVMAAGKPKGVNTGEQGEKNVLEYSHGGLLVNAAQLRLYFKIATFILWNWISEMNTDFL